MLSEDIYLLKQIRVTLDATKISIVDARSLLNAKANQVLFVCQRSRFDFLVIHKKPALRKAFICAKFHFSTAPALFGEDLALFHHEAHHAISVSIM